MSVWDALVGQRAVAATLRSAASGEGMTHAWLLTGPPGSGRSNAAVAFAAALQCEADAGCGECRSCREVLAGSHPDVTVRRTDKIVISIADARDWVREASLMPVRDRRQVIVVEDADRLHERANVLLKAIEEPGAKTVWVLCAPHAEDVLPTIRSRTRHVNLSTPTAAEVTDFLVTRHRVAPALAAHAARASQGHIGRARALAEDEGTRNRRREVVALPTKLTSLGACMTAAANLVDIATQEAAAQTERLGAQELRDLETLYGEDRKAKSSRAYKAAAGELARTQKQRDRRAVLDVLDRSLMDLLSVYRDVVQLQLGGRTSLVNEEQRPQVEELARHTTPEDNLRRIDAVHEAREQMIEFNTPPLLAMESMTVALRVDARVGR